LITPDLPIKTRSDLPSNHSFLSFVSLSIQRNSSKTVPIGAHKWLPWSGDWCARKIKDGQGKQDDK
jgi:hypothetical protein